MDWKSPISVVSRILCLVSLIFSSVSVCGADDNIFVADAPVDYTEACALTDRIGVDELEGVWEYPGDDIIVFIRRDARKSHQYNITVVESADVRLRPGQLLGTLTDSAVGGDYSMRLYTGVTNGVLAKAMECHAQLSSDGASLLTDTPDLKLKISAGMVLPLFWRRLRVSVRPDIDDPSDKIKEGMRRLYPLPASRRGLRTRYF